MGAGRDADSGPWPILFAQEPRPKFADGLADFAGDIRTAPPYETNNPQGVSDEPSVEYARGDPPELPVRGPGDRQEIAPFLAGYPKCAPSKRESASLGRGSLTGNRRTARRPRKRAALLQAPWRRSIFERLRRSDTRARVHIWSASRSFLDLPYEVLQIDRSTRNRVSTARAGRGH